jgi:hypothetical protein
LENDIHKDNFWDVKTNLKAVEPFKSLYDRDKSKKKDRTSRIMWAIHMCTSPTSAMYGMPGNKERLAEDYLDKIKDFDWEDYEEIEEEYISTQLLPAEQELHNWNMLMRKRRGMLQEMYDNELSKDPEERNIAAIIELDKLMSNTAKMFADYIKIKKEFDEELMKKETNTTEHADY